MPDLDLADLRAKAEAALKAKGDNARWEALDALEAAADPATIIALLDSLTSLEEQVRADGEALGFYAREWLTRPLHCTGAATVYGFVNQIVPPKDLAADRGAKARARLSARGE